MDTATVVLQITAIVGGIIVLIQMLVPSWKGNTVLTKIFEIIEKTIGLIIPNFVKEESTGGKPKITTKSPNLITGFISLFKKRNKKRR